LGATKCRIGGRHVRAALATTHGLSTVGVGWYLFKRGSLKVASRGWTLHQLRHSALTHLAEEGVNLPLLMAKSGHQSLRSLQRYARPGAESVAAMTAAHDPARRRR